ncbi:hypothetical protein [Clostridium tyrobutyricum]|nr:hypothetical protein [Clostridium tyrobutyricum]
MSEDRKKSIGKSDSDKSKKQIVVDINWWADNYNSVDERFQKWLIN